MQLYVSTLKDEDTVQITSTQRVVGWGVVRWNLKMEGGA